MKKNGFVMIETIIVMTVLSVGMISLYATYSLLASKATTKSKYDNAEYIYKTYFIANFIAKNKTCKFANNIETITNLNKVATSLGANKIYCIMNIPSVVKDNLLNFDGTTIDYLRSIKNNYTATQKLYIVQFKVKDSTDDSLYKTYFASIDASKLKE